jgi:hypothetical protein
MKPLIMQFSPTTSHFISLRSKYSPQHPVLEHPQAMFLLYCTSRTIKKQENKEHKIMKRFILCTVRPILLNYYEQNNQMGVNCGVKEENN